jgi:16S rRNA C967 or C1407 C5-methylase (RsmB/RsmF family)
MVDSLDSQTLPGTNFPVEDEPNASKAANESSMKTESKPTLSHGLKEFYANHNVDVESLLDNKRLGVDGEENDENNQWSRCAPYRFVRLNPRYDANETLQLLQQELLDQKNRAVRRSSNIESNSTSATEKNDMPLKVPWLDNSWGFYAIPGNFSMTTSSCFRSGRVYAMDVSSGAGVATLLTNRYDQQHDDNGGSSESANQACFTETKTAKNLRILDLCCAPGLKLCAMADFLCGSQSTIIGVDVSESRIALCKRIVHKYHIDPGTCASSANYYDKVESTTATTTANQQPSASGVAIRLYCQDGTTFGGFEKQQLADSTKGMGNLVFDSCIAMEELRQCGTRKRKNKSARAREKKRLRQVACLDWNNTNECDQSSVTAADSDPPQRMKLFDRVLVDAECSTDGSLKHLQQKLKESSSSRTSVPTTNELLTDQVQLAELVDLQKRLIASGFHLLKPGGSMVYSTCSLATEQNEQVVQWLLDQYPTQATLIPIEFSIAQDIDKKMVSEGSLAGTVQFAPNINSPELFGGGFFLAKIGKKNTMVLGEISSVSCKGTA